MRVVVPAQREGICCFDNHDTLAVPCREVIDIVGEIVESSVPPGVKRQSDKIEFDAFREEVVEKPYASAVVAAVGEMDHRCDRISRRRVMHTIDAGLDESPELYPLRGIVPGIADEAVVPEHSASDLVADLDPVGSRVLRDQRSHNISRVSVHAVGKFRGRQPGPGRRLVLFSRIGPGVGIMEIKEQPEAERAGSGGHIHRLFESAVTIGRRVPYPEADKVYPMRGEYLERVSRLS
jgi:hypothetical protein